MIFDIGCELSISKLAEIMDRIQKSDKHKHLSCRIQGGRKGCVVLENSTNRQLLRLERSIYDSWPFIPDNNIDQLYTDTPVCRRWGLDVHSLQSFNIKNIDEKSESERTEIMSIIQHVNLFAFFSEWKYNLPKTV